MKSKIKLFYRVLLILLVTACVNGCMSFSDNMLPSLSKSKNKTQAVVEASVDGNFLYRLSGGKFITSREQGKRLNEKFFDIWEDNDYIKSYSTVSNEEFTGKADYNITLSGTQITKFNLFTYMVNTWTIGLIPCTVYNDYDLKYTLKNVKTGQEYTVPLHDGFTTTWWLPYIVAFPFAHNADHNTFDRLSENLYQDLVKQGAFK